MIIHHYMILRRLNTGKNRGELEWNWRGIVWRVIEEDTEGEY
jgi:hypothetical protein